MEKLGIDPSASRMLSERSAIWATSPLLMQKGDVFDTVSTHMRIWLRIAMASIRMQFQMAWAAQAEYFIFVFALQLSGWFLGFDQRQRSFKSTEQHQPCQGRIQECARDSSNLKSMCYRSPHEEMYPYCFASTWPNANRNVSISIPMLALHPPVLRFLHLLPVIWDYQAIALSWWPNELSMRGVPKHRLSKFILSVTSWCNPEAGMV